MSSGSADFGVARLHKHMSQYKELINQSLVAIVVQLLSHVWLFVTPWTVACQASLSLTISQSLPNFMFTVSVMPSSCLILWCPLLLPSIFPSIRDFLMSQLFASGDQNTGVSASESILPTSLQGLFPLILTGLISLMSKGLSGVFSSPTVWRHQFFRALPSSLSSSHNHTWPLGRPWPWLYWPLSMK